LTAEFDLAGARRQFPFLQLRLGTSLSGLLALGASGRLLVRRPHVPIGRGMLFQKKRGQLLAQQASHVFAFRERYQLFLVRLPEHSLEGLTSALQPTLAQLLPILPAQK
jgi:hypothetical protein